MTKNTKSTTRLGAVLATPQETGRALPTSLAVAIEDWLASLMVKNYSPHTLSAYRKNIYQFAHFISADDKLKDNWQACEQKHLSWFISERFDQDHIKNSSAKQALSAVRRFYQFAILKELCQSNPATGYRLRSSGRTLPKIGDEDLMKRLLEQPMPDDAEHARLWIRDRAMFELMYSSGLRLSELVGLDVGDVDLAQKTVRVLGKGNKTRIVPVGSHAVQALQVYLPHRELWQEGTEALFISERHGTRLTPRAVQLRLKVCANRANIEQNLHPHILRHCFASHLLSASGDLRAVQEMLGHESVATTQIYTQVDFGSLTKIYDKAHPRAVAYVIDDKG